MWAEFKKWQDRSPLLLRCLDDYLAGKRYPLDLIYTDAAVMDLPPLAT
mgnify:CR=1 FL=1